MKLSEHLDKGIWTIADKTLLLLYGFAVIIFVIGILPEDEWGAFFLFQSIFLILSILTDAIFLQPMVKFASEHEAEELDVLAAAFNLYTIPLIIATFIISGFSRPIALLFQSPEIGLMLPLLPAFVALSIFRNVGIRFLQVSLNIQGIFWIDLTFFGSIVLMVILATALNLFHTAQDFLTINMIGAAISSLVSFFFSAKAFRAMPLLRVPREEYGKLLGFAKFQAGTSALMTLQQWSDALIIGAFYPPKEVALYGAAKTLYRFFDAVREGTTLLVVPISSKLYSAKEFDSLSTVVEKLLFLFFAALVPISFGLAIVAKPLMHIIFQGKYDGAAPVFQILILTGFTLPLSLISTNVLIGVGRVRNLFLSTLISTIVYFILNYLLVPTLASKGAALAVLISMTLWALLTYFAMRADVAVSTRGILKRSGAVRQFVSDRRKRSLESKTEDEDGESI